GDADVHADVARANLVAELPRGGAARREDARHVAERRCVHRRNGIVQAWGIDEAQHRAEDFGPGELTCRLRDLQYGRTDEVAVLEPLDVRAATVQEHRGALGLSSFNQVLDPPAA